MGLNAGEDFDAHEDGGGGQRPAQDVPGSVVASVGVLMHGVSMHQPPASSLLIFRMARAGSQIFDANVARFDFHGGRGAVQLDADEALHLAAGLIVVDELAHHMAIDQLDQDIAAGDDVGVVPIIGLDETLQFGAVPDRPHVGRLLAAAGVIELAAKGKETPGPLLIDLAGISLPCVDIELVALHDPPGDVGKFHAAVLDTAVSGVRAGHSVLHLELEIGGLAIAPDAENVLLGLMDSRGFARDYAVFDAPEIRVAVPPLEALAIEDRPEAGFFKRRDVGLGNARHCRQKSQTGQEAYPTGSNHHLSSLPRTLTQLRVAADSSTAPVTSSVSRPSRNVGAAGFPSPRAVRKSAA